MIAGLLALTLTAGIAVHDAATAARNAATAARNAASAERQHNIALSRQLAADSLSIDPADPVTARQLAVAAWAVFPTSQADSAITTLLAEQQRMRLADAPLHADSGPKGRVSWVVLTPDDKPLNSAAAGTAPLWIWATSQPAGASIRAGAPNGVLVVPLWNLAPSQPPGGSIRAGAPNGVLVVPFGPDGKLPTSADDDGTVRRWQVLLAAHPYAALCVYVGPPTRQEWDHYALGEPQPKVCR